MSLSSLEKFRTKNPVANSVGYLCFGAPREILRRYDEIFDENHRFGVCLSQ